MEAISDEQLIILTAKERKRLASYLDVLIEMHFEYKRNHRDDKTGSVLLSLAGGIKQDSAACEIGQNVIASKKRANI
ncbi:MAG: hypothetical protein LBT19_00900 [Candidatus Nomurabacteria bacterium]|jgi:hypothetical protein|nr:hypothetical protein [Candidatus Nomurabacteria bacterium]